MNAPQPLAAMPEAADLAAPPARARPRARCCSTPPSRGRYATDASIYQIMPVGVFVPTHGARRRHRDRHRARPAACRCCRAAAAPRSAARRRARRWSSTPASTCATCSTSTRTRRTVDGRARHRARPPQRLAEAARPVVPGRRVDQRAGHARRHGRQQLLRLALASPTATWCTTCSASSAWLADGRAARRSGRSPALRRRASARSPTSCAAWPSSSAPRSRPAGPRCMRRVAGYNLDIFATAERAALHRRRQRQPGPPAGRRRGHAGLHAQPDAAARARCRAPRCSASSTSRPSTPRWTRRSTSSSSGPSAVELVDRTMIELALRQPGVPADDRDGADRPSPTAILLVEFSGDDKAALLRQAARAGRADGRPRPARQRGRDARRRAAEGAVGGAQGRPEHHDEPEGRRQAGQLHRGLRGAARTPGRVHRCADRGVRAARHARHLVRARLGRHAARAADPRHARATAPRKMRAIADEAAALVRKYKGAYSGEHGDGLCRGEWIAWQFGPRINAGVPRHQAAARPDQPVQPRQDHRPAEDGRRARCSASRRGYQDDRADSRCSTGRPGTCRTIRSTEATTAPGSGGDSTGGLAKAVEMCNNNGHCRKFDAGTMCPSYRVTRDEQHLTRGRANTLRLALSGQLGADALHRRRGARGAGPVRRLQGLQARLPDRRRHGEDEDRVPGAATRRATACTLKDRLIAHLPDYAPLASRLPWLFNLRDRVPVRRRLSERWLGLSAAALAAALAARHLLARGAVAAARHARPKLLAADQAGGAVRRHLQRPLRDRERPRRGARAAGRRLHACTRRAGARRRAPVLRPHLPGRRHGRRGQGRARAQLIDALLPLARARHRRSSASSRRAC